MKPYLKWAGGKEAELKFIRPRLPHDIQRYFEPFVGGGAVFLDLAEVNKAQEYFINDISFELMTFYSYLKNENKKFFDIIELLNSAWIEVDELLNNKEKELVGYYYDYKKTLNIDKLEKDIFQFLERNGSNLPSLLNEQVAYDTEKLKGFMDSIVLNKYMRTVDTEKKKGEMTDSGLFDIILSAFKSSVYTYFREIFNEGIKKNTDISEELFIAAFYFMREFSFSGMFRFNANGEFNVPYGGISYNKKTLDDKINRMKLATTKNIFKKTILTNKDFSEFLSGFKFNSDDFIFFDPPYDTEFSTYNNIEFLNHDQVRLRNKLLELPAKFMMIIKNTDFIYDLYKDTPLKIEEFSKNYQVSFQNRNDKSVTHLIITNY